MSTGLPPAVAMLCPSLLAGGEPGGCCHWAAGHDYWPACLPLVASRATTSSAHVHVHCCVARRPQRLSATATGALQQQPTTPIYVCVCPICFRPHGGAGTAPLQHVGSTLHRAFHWVGWVAWHGLSCYCNVRTGWMGWALHARAEPVMNTHMCATPHCPRGCALHTHTHTCTLVHALGLACAFGLPLDNTGARARGGEGGAPPHPPL